MPHCGTAKCSTPRLSMYLFNTCLSDKHNHLCGNTKTGKAKASKRKVANLTFQLPFSLNLSLKFSERKERWGMSKKMFSS